MPNGTSKISSSPSAPVIRALPPLPPSLAIMCLRYFKWISVQNCLLPRKIICPPLPPFPPSGPPFAVNLLRCKCADPAPPLPERQQILT